MKINRIKCNLCGYIIQSFHTHDFKRCICGRVAVDGGLDYARRIYKKEGDYTDLSVFDDE